MKVLGIDIGGSGIKAAVVDVRTGELLTQRERRDTPDHSTPASVGREIRALIRHHKWHGLVGLGFPGVVRNNVIHTAVNLDEGWVGQNLAAMVTKSTRCPAHVVNDADAAGVAEAAFGAGRDRPGTVLLLTLGTGVGSALIHDGKLVANTEFGHLKFHQDTIESFAAASVRKEKDLRWSRWSKRVNRVLRHLDYTFSPELIILGGGVSAKFEKMSAHFDKSLPVVPAQMLNEAGIIGAALAAAQDVAARKAQRPSRSRRR